ERLDERGAGRSRGCGRPNLLRDPVRGSGVRGERPSGDDSESAGAGQDFEPGFRWETLELALRVGGRKTLSADGQGKRNGCLGSAKAAQASSVRPDMCKARHVFGQTW